MRKQKVITLILLGVFLAGLCLLLYPSVSNYWNSITQSRAIVDYDTIVKSLSPKDYTAYFERAEEYNSELKALPFPLTEYQQISGYDDCLNAAGDGVIGYIGCVYHRSVDRYTGGGNAHHPAAHSVRLL